MLVSLYHINTYNIITERSGKQPEVTPYQPRYQTPTLPYQPVPLTAITAYPLLYPLLPYQPVPSRAIAAWRGIALYIEIDVVVLIVIAGPANTVLGVNFNINADV